MRISDWSSDVCSSDLGSRRIAAMTAGLGGKRRLSLTPAGPVFAMSGLGYTPPLWGHGLDHGPELAVEHDNLPETERGWGNPLALHVPARVTADPTAGRRLNRGRGVPVHLCVGRPRTTRPAAL